MTPDERTSTSTLLGDVVARASRLVRLEIDLAKAEVRENLSRAGVGLAVVAVAFLLALTALDVLAAAAVAALASAGMAAGAAALVIGGLLLGVAAVLAAWGVKSLKPSNLAPDRTARNLKRDAEMIREKFHA